MLNRSLIFLILCLFCSSSLFATMDRYQRNQCQDRAVYITMLTGLIAAVGLITPGAYVLSPRGDFNMEPACPSSSPVTCCDAKTSQQNATSSPSNCTQSSNSKCDAPKVPYCFGATVPADFKYQSWVLKTGIPLVVFGGLGFLTAVGAGVTGCCIGTCCFG